MTTPGQVAPDGAYTVGGGAYKYGQALQEDFVRNLMMGGLRNISLTSLFDAVPLFEQALRRLPLDALRMAKPFFIGSTDADWVDVDTSVATIMGSLKIFEKFADFIKELERITGLNFSHGPVEFLLSLFVALTKATGLDFANGPIAFLLSIFTALSKATGLDFANGPIAFLASIFTALSTATGLDFANGPAAFLTSLATQVTTIASNLLKPLADLVQALIDGIAGIWAGVPVIGKPLQDALTAIAGILGIGQGAAAAAAQANMGVSAILAQQAGGFSDEFDYTLANNLPAVWQKKTPLADSYGPDGSGIARGVMAGTGTGPVQYVQTSKPLTAADMKVTGVLARVPWWDLLVKSSWYLLVQANPTDRTAYGVDIMNTTCQFFSLNAAGVQTNIGTAKTIPANAAGLPYTLEIKGTTLTLYRNHIVAATQAVSAALPGRCVGFGGFKPVYTNLTDNPLAQFAGIAWQPA